MRTGSRSKNKQRINSRRKFGRSTKTKSSLRSAFFMLSSMGKRSQRGKRFRANARHGLPARKPRLTATFRRAIISAIYTKTFTICHFSGISKMFRKIFFLALALAACEQKVAPKQPCELVDYYGEAHYMLTDSSLNFISTHDLAGKFSGVRQDSNIFGTFTGTFCAPLGDNSFTASGSIQLMGILQEDTTDNSLDLIFIRGDSDFVRIDSGDVYLYWTDGDPSIWFVGSLCFITPAANRREIVAALKSNHPRAGEVPIWLGNKLIWRLP